MAKNSSITLFVLLLCCGNLTQGKSQPVGAACNDPIAVNIFVGACSNKTTQQPGLYSAIQTITVYWTC